MIEKKRYDISLQNFLYAILLLSQPIMFFSLIVDNRSLERILSYVIYICGLGLFALRFIKDKVKYSDIFLAGFCLLYVIKIFVFNDGLSSFINWVSFFLSLIAWDSGDDIQSTQNIKNLIFVSYVLQGIIFLMFSLTAYAYKPYVEGTKVADVLTLGIDNPNQTGMMLLINILVLWICCKGILKKRLKIFIFIEIIGLIVLLFLTAARTSIITFLFIVVFSKIYGKDGKDIKHNSPILKTTILTLIPLLFIISYELLYNIDYFQKLTIFGKPLFSGREELYRDIFSKWENILLGDINIFHFHNTHNAYLGVLVNIGIIGFILFFLFIFSKTKNIFQEKKKYSLPYWMVWGIFMISCAESALLTSGTIYFVMLYTLFFLLKQER